MPHLHRWESSWPPVDALSQSQHDRALFLRVSSCGATERGRGSLPTWSGVLPPRCTDMYPPGGLSSKLFMGGLPLDLSKDGLMYALREFHPVCVEWSGLHTRSRGFAYVTLENDHCVHALLHASRREGTKWICRFISRSMRTKDVEVIPWAVADSNWMCPEASKMVSMRLEPRRTVFVGALHGSVSAYALALIMNDLFSGVVYAGIDTDKYKYPFCSGRVTFDNVDSFVRAIASGFVEIRTDKFTKKIQVDPYLENSICSVCNLHLGPYFCREPVCFSYFCRSCWVRQHPSEGHRALVHTCYNVTGRKGGSCQRQFTVDVTKSHSSPPPPSTSGWSAQCGNSPLAPDLAP